MTLNIFIIVLTLLVSLLAWNQQQLFSNLKFNPYLAKERKEYWRLLSYGLIHADWIHLFVNMFVLYSFGNLVLQYFDLLFEGKAPFYYLLLYIGGLIVASAPGYIRHKNNPYYNAVGASGAVSAVLFSSIVFNPMSKIYLFFIPIGIPAVLFGVLYLVYSAYMDKKAKDNVGHDAHFWGGVFGFFLTIAIEPNLFMHFVNEIISGIL
jgi:membrane associated rhomboid family serine protease